MEPSELSALLAAALALGIPATHVAAALLVPRRDPLRVTVAAGAVALVLALAFAALTTLAPLSSAMTSLGVRLDAVTCVMLVLVSFLGLVTARYSRTYFRGDAAIARHARWLGATLGSVSLLVSTDHLGVLALAWIATSLALHRLLTLRSERPGAVLAAHEKFVMSRIADTCLVVAIGLLALEAGTLEISALHHWARGVSELPPRASVAAVLLVAGACLKSAQVPFHGWLTRVMEAPTPVSALLHAGVVNLGGLLMIRLAPLMALAPLAQALLAVVGLGTALLASSVMTTRVSVKVALAWSTSAQMGFMLLECALGAWHLALLHLVAHSLYKAHAFLSAGSTVERWSEGALVAPLSAPSPRSLALATAASLAWVAPIALVPVLAMGGGAELLPMSVILAISLAPTTARALAAGARQTGRAALAGAGLAALYFGWHSLATHLLDASAQPSVLGWTLVALALAAQLAAMSAMQAAPSGALARWLQPLLSAGLYVDALFTRATLHVWPPRLSPSALSARPLTASDLEA